MLRIALILSVALFFVNFLTLAMMPDGPATNRALFYATACVVLTLIFTSGRIK